MRILCVDDHAVLREGLALIINRQADMRVVASAATGEEAIELYDRWRPDVTIMDLELPGMSGIEAIRVIRAKDRSARIVMLTMHHDAENIVRAMDAGATTYVLKDTISTTLINVLRSVHDGGRPIPEDVAGQLARRAAQPALTPREIQILELIVDGRSNKDVAVELRISEDTVRTHLKNIFQKLHVSGRTAAVTTAVRRGLLRLNRSS